MEAVKKTDDHMASAAAFVEGGVQEASDDACSICLENFSQSDPSTVTSCKHEFHLQCILEWCQRSSNCPMCWQLISLRDATSQELLKAMEEERNLRSTRSRNDAMFRHPSLIDFDLQHMLQLPMGTSELELEEHIFQHLAAAAGVGRGRHIFRGEGQGNWSPSRGNHPLFIFPEPNALHDNSADDQVPTVSVSRAQTRRPSIHREGSNVASIEQQRILPGTRSFASQSSQGSQETGGLSDLQSFSESLRSRINTWSMRYKESFSRNTRGWKERLFSRSTSMAEVGSEVRREVNAGIGSISRLMERLDARENDGSGHAAGSSNLSNRNNMNNLERHSTQMRESKVTAPRAENSASD